MKSIDEVVSHLKTIMPEAEFHAHGGSGPTSKLIEFIESMREHVVFCRKCDKLRLDPGVEMTINNKPVELCEGCLDEFLTSLRDGEVDMVEYELEDGTTLTEKPGSGVMTVHEPDMKPYHEPGGLARDGEAVDRPDKDREDRDPWKEQRRRARDEGVDDMVFGSDGHGPPK